MKSTKPLEIEVSAKGMHPKKFEVDASSVLAGNGRVEVAPHPSGILLRAIWEEDAEVALWQLSKSLGCQLESSHPRIVYQKGRQLMEPVMRVTVTVPEEFMGDVMGDLNRRRGLVHGIEDEERAKRILANVPLAELIGYRSDLGSYTKGNGKVSVEFFEYQPAPTDHGPGPNEPASAALRA